MGTRKFNEINSRTIHKSGAGSYSITLPIHLVRQLKWQEHQEVTVKRKGKQLIIEDA